MSGRRETFFSYGWVCSALVCWLLLGSVSAVQAEPYLAIREGYKCSFCHVNQTGGGKRTGVVSAHADEWLKYPKDLFSDFEARAPITGQIVDGVSIGADFRGANTTLFRDKPNAKGRVRNNTAFRSADSNDFEIAEASAYLEVNLIKDALTFYLDESFGPGSAFNRETFGLLTGFLPWNMYIKAGKFFPPYGFRLQDDAAFSRSRTGFNFTSPDTGVEVGLAPGNAFLSVAVTNGTGVSRGQRIGKQVSLNGYYLFSDVPVVRNVWVGGSFAYNSLKGKDRTLYGFHAGLNLWRLTMLGEIDFIEDEQLPQRASQFGGYGEINWLVCDWMNAKFAYDYFDPSRQRGDQALTRYSFGVEPFLSKFLQLRLFYRVYNGVPEKPQDNFDQLITEMHVFF
jgi:hypothetical protein